MRRSWVLALSCLMVCLAFVPTALGASYRLIGSVAIPGNPLASFDIGWVDQGSQTYYLADRSNAGIDVVNAATGSFVRTIGGFKGFTGDNDTSGPNGVVVAPEFNLLFAGDGDSSLKVVNLSTNKITSVSTGGQKRADELAWAPDLRMIAIANDADSPPFISFILVVPEANQFIVLNKLAFPDATDGIEQPVYNPQTHLFDVAIPATTAHPGGEVAVVSPPGILLNAFRVSGCNPHGLALGPNQNLLLGCSVHAGPTLIMSASDGSILASVAGLGGSDEVWFNTGDNHYYLAASNNASGPVLGIIDAASRTAITPFPTTGTGAHSVAADASNNHIFVPLRPGSACAKGCIGIFALS